jgi:ATP-binding cassette subfamily B protein
MDPVEESRVAEQADFAHHPAGTLGREGSAALAPTPEPRHAAAPDGGPIKTLLAAAAASPLLWTALPIGMIASVGLETALALALRYLIDAAIVPTDAALLNHLVVALIMGLLVVVVATLVRDRAYAKLGSRALSDLRGKIFERLLALPHDYYLRTRSADLAARFTGDLAVLRVAVVASVPEAAIALLQILASGGVLIWLDWRLASIALLGLPFSMIAPAVIGRRAADLSYRVREQEAALAHLVQQQIDGETVTRAFGLEAASIERFHGQASELARQAERFSFFGYLTQRSASLSMLAFYLAMIGIGALLTFDGALSVGTLAAFSALFFQVSAAVARMTNTLPPLLEASSSLRRIAELLNSGPLVADSPGAVAMPEPQQEIRFDTVTFGYPGTNSGVFAISMTIPIGGLIAVVGPSGSGKTTLIKLLARFHDPAGGTVSIDGRDLRSLTLASLRQHLGIVFQETFLFDGSVAQNIRVGKPGASDVEVEKAAREAEVHDMIMRLPEGYATRIGEGGSRLSSGERQRLAIARVLLRNPMILLLDEITSAQDAATEHALNRTLRRLAEARTVITLTHRLAAVADARTCFVLDRGRLVEHGTQQALVAQGGLFAALWAKQSGFHIDHKGGAAHVDVQRLARFPLFSTLDVADLTQLAGLFGTETFEEGRTVVKQGDIGQSFYIIARGVVEVLREEPDKPPRHLATLADGDHFGEIALLEAIPRTATVETRATTTLLTLNRATFTYLCDRVPGVRARIEAIRAERDRLTAERDL